MNAPYSEEQTAIIKDLAVQIAGSTRTTHEGLVLLTAEVKELRDTRFRPYLTSMGLFVMLVLSVTGYVYKVEMGFARAVFMLQDRMQSIELRGEINNNRIEDVAERVERAIERGEQYWGKYMEEE